MIVAVQGHALELARGAADSGVAESRFFHDVDSAQEFVYRTLEPGDIVLVKGSRGVHLEKIVTGSESALSRRRRSRCSITFSTPCIA